MSSETEADAKGQVADAATTADAAPSAGGLGQRRRARRTR